MAITDHHNKEIRCKVLYTGPTGSGKTTNLQSIYQLTHPALPGRLKDYPQDRGLPDDVTRVAPPPPTRLFDMLPLSMGFIKDYRVEVNLYTLPSVELYPTLPYALLADLDAMVFVADATPIQLPSNRDCLRELKELLAELNIDFLPLIKVLQVNKVDSQVTMPTPIIRQELSAQSFACIEAVARESCGTLETLRSVTHSMLTRVFN